MRRFWGAADSTWRKSAACFPTSLIGNYSVWLDSWFSNKSIRTINILDLNARMLVRMFRKYLLMHFSLLNNLDYFPAWGKSWHREVQNTEMLDLSSRHQNSSAKDKVGPAFPQRANSGIREGHRIVWGSSPAVMRGEEQPAGSIIWID